MTLVFRRDHYALFNESALGSALAGAAQAVGRKAYPAAPAAR